MEKFDTDINSATALLQGSAISKVHKKVHKPHRGKKRKRYMKENTLVFTQGFIERLDKPKTREMYYDKKVQGLQLENMPSGSKIFRYRKKDNGLIQRTTIGNFEDISLEEARDIAIKLSAKLIDGANFITERQKVATEPTLEQLFDLYFEEHLENRRTTASEIKKEFKRWFKDALGVKLTDLNPIFLQRIINKLAANGKHIYRANKALDYIKAVLNWGMRKDLCEKNPALKIDGFKMQARERFIQPDEFYRLLSEIENYADSRLRDFFFLCLWTAARSGKVRAMRWDEINLSLGTWFIEKNKNGESQTIKLTDEALAIIKERHSKRGTIPWVFPGGRYEHKPTLSHLQEPKKAWISILKKAKIEDVHIHDLRRTLASYMVMNGASTSIVQKQLHHKSLQAAAIYQRVNNDAVKAAADSAIKVIKHFAENPDREKSAVSS